MQEISLAFYLDIGFLGQFVEPSQPDVAPRSDVVVPDGELHGSCGGIAHFEPFTDGLGEVATCGHTVFNFTAPAKSAPPICERLKFVR